MIMGWFTKKEPNEESGFAAGGNRKSGVPSKRGWGSTRDSDATAPLKAPVNDERGFGHTGRKRRDK